MGRLLFKVQETFKLKDVGLVIVADNLARGLNLKIGDELELRRPDGTSLMTTVDSLPLLCPFDPERQLPISLPKGIGKEDVPIGTEVWSHP